MPNKVSANPTDYIDGYNELMFLINTVINNKVRTAELVSVIANNGDGTIDVLPIISDTDNEGNPITQSPIFGVKYMEWQYGINAFQAEPAVGDVGLVVVCTKDTQNAKSGIVGSFGKFALESGIYFGGLKVLNLPATQFIKMDENGITITTPKTLTINATENVLVNATKDVTVNGVNAVVNASTKANVIAPEVNLGIEGGLGVATIGKRVTVDGSPSGTTVGFIAEGSTIVKSG